MIVVIQCAKTKTAGAGHLRLPNGKEVKFVAHPSDAPSKSGVSYARPDDAADTGKPWRVELLDYNLRHIDNPNYNPLGLLPAWQFYDRQAYRMLVGHFGTDRFYILSAGWGLVKSDFLIPYYDIAFSPAPHERHQRRLLTDLYHDFALLPNDNPEPIIFLGGKHYVPLFCRLTKESKARRIVLHNSKQPPTAPNCEIHKFPTQQKTTWYYKCAEDLVEENSKIKMMLSLQ